MISRNSPMPEHAANEVRALIETLHKTGQRLDELMAGEVDTVADAHGRAFMLQRAQEHLRQSDAVKQAAILNALPAHIALLDKAGFIVTINDAWRRFAAENALQDSADAVGANYVDVCEAAHGPFSAEAPAVARGIRRVLAGEAQSFSIEYPCHSPTKQRWFLLEVTPLDAHARLGAVVMHLDVSAERQAEARSRLIIESALDAVVVVDATGSIAGWNVQAAKTFGWSAESAIGMSLTALVPVRYRAAHHQSIRTFLHAGESPIFGKRIQASALHKDGHEFPVELTVSPVKLGDAWIFSAFVRDLTEKKRDKAALQRFAAAMDATPDAIYLVDRLTMRYIYVNASACKMRNHTREQLLALGPAGLMDIPEAELAREYDDIIASGKPAEPVEMLRPRDDGSPAWIELRRHAKRFGDDWVIVSLARDITERKRVAAELEESEFRFSDMMGNVDLLSIIIDMQSRIIYCNDFFIALTGWRREELLGQMYVDLIVPPDLRDEVRGVHAAMVVDSAAARHHENEIVTRSGERRLIRWNNSALRSSSGAVIGTASIGEDITERKRAEQALMDSELQQRHLIEQLKTERSRLVDAQRVAKVGSWETNLETLAVIWSDETHRIYGTDPVTFHPTHNRFLELVHPQDRAQVDDAFKRSLPENETYHHIEHRALLADGRTKFIEERWRVFFDALEKPIRVVGTSHDITARIHAENEIRTLNADLERRVAERTAELEAVNRELESFDYSVSHDLKAPIRRIEGFSNMVLEDYGDKLDDHGRNCLKRIHDAALRMDQLVNDLLALSMISKSEIVRSEIDLSALAQTTFAELEETQPGSKLDFVVEPGLIATADRGLLRIVLVNLLGNGRKFTSKRDGAKMEFGRHATEDGQAFFVRDNGAGFDAAYADRLFAPFQRLHTESEFAGTGIGLATVRRIITRHGGHVWADGVVDQGVTIHFTLPS